MLTSDCQKNQKQNKPKMRLDDVVHFTGVFLILAPVSSFANSILSLECPGKDVSGIRKEFIQFELALVLYYVSWCRKSRIAKEVYAEVARYYHDEVRFAAVDCWHLECNCSQTIPSSLGSKQGYPQKWPTLIVHYGRHYALQYYDEWSVMALSRFINNLLRPVIRLNSKDDLKFLNMRSNAVVLGLFQNTSTIEYYRFTIAAIKWLENDPERLVVFAVCVGEPANDIVKGLGTTTPLIVLVSDKEIQVFNHVGDRWRSNTLNAWLQIELKRMSKHFMGYSTPQLLLDHVRKGTVLAIFASDFEHSSRNFYVHMSSVLQTLGFTPSVVTTLKGCKKFYDNDLINSVQQFNEIDIQKELDDLYRSSKSICKGRLKLNSGYEPFMRSNVVLSKTYMMRYQPSVQFQANDRYSSENLLDFYRYNECLKGHQSQNKPELQIVFAKLLTKFIEKIAESSLTRRNHTMSVQIMDSSKYQDILQTLGGIANLENIQMSSKTTVLIIELNQEGVYALQKPFHYETLLGFINDYYQDNLMILRKTATLSLVRSAPIYNLQDLNRQAFFNKIKHFWHNTTTVLLLYTPQCAFCSMMSHALVQVSTLLHNSQNFHHINMLRLNTQTNDLPWEFVTHFTPALFVFPRGRPSESRLFPSNLQIDVRNVFAFILAQLDPIEQVSVALGSCSPPTQRLIKCLHFVKTLAMQHIGHHLKLWQIFENERQLILKRLKQFKDITLGIQEKLLL